MRAIFDDWGRCCVRAETVRCYKANCQPEIAGYGIVERCLHRWGLPGKAATQVRATTASRRKRRGIRL